jgi:hypothetical protein
MFGLMGAVGVIAVFGAVASADRLADPAEALVTNPSAVRVNVGETDQSAKMDDYYVVVESVRPATEIGPLPAVILREIARIGETDRSSGMFVSEGVQQRAVLGQLQRVGETDRLAGMSDYYVLPEIFAPAARFEPLSLAIQLEIERVNREH